MYNYTTPFSVLGEEENTSATAKQALVWLAEHSFGVLKRDKQSLALTKRQISAMPSELARVLRN